MANPKHGQRVATTILWLAPQNFVGKKKHYNYVDPPIIANICSKNEAVLPIGINLHTMEANQPDTTYTDVKGSEHINHN